MKNKLDKYLKLDIPNDDDALVAGPFPLVGSLVFVTVLALFDVQC